MTAAAKDWLVLWRVYGPQLYGAYIVFIVPAMFLCARRVVTKHSTLAGLVLSLASFLVVVRYPVGGFVWMVIEILLGGEAVPLPPWTGISFAPLMALGGAAAGALILRLVYRQRVGKKQFALLFAGNLVTAVLAITAILILITILPPHMIA